MYILFFLLTSFSLPFSELSLVGLAFDVVMPLYVLHTFTKFEVCMVFLSGVLAYFLSGLYAASRRR